MKWILKRIGIFVLGVGLLGATTFFIIAQEKLDSLDSLESIELAKTGIGERAEHRVKAAHIPEGDED